MNKVVLTGRVSHEPTVREFNNGRILIFSIVVNEKYKDKSGQERELAHFFDVEAVGSAASMSLSKGDLITVEGSLRQDRWESPSGERKSRVKIVVFKITPQSPKKQTEIAVVPKNQTPQKQTVQKQPQTQKTANYKYKKAV